MLLSLVDALRKMLVSIETTGSRGRWRLFRCGCGDHVYLDGSSTPSSEARWGPGSPDAAAPPAGLPPAAVASAEESGKGPGNSARQRRHDRGARGRADAEREAALASSTIRVDVGLLDKLMNLVGELVLARNQVLQFTTITKDASFLRTAQRLNLITTELQEGVMKTRMQPIGNVWNKFPRVVRDLAVSCGKQVRIEMDGADTELDKTIIEAIKDPLTHSSATPSITASSRRNSGARRESRRKAGCRCAPSTRAARSTSRSATTAPASTSSG